MPYLSTLAYASAKAYGFGVSEVTLNVEYLVVAGGGGGGAARFLYTMGGGVVTGHGDGSGSGKD